jgi:hypothetical protein
MQNEGWIGSIPSRKHEEHLSPSYASPLPCPPALQSKKKDFSMSSAAAKHEGAAVGIKDGLTFLLLELLLEEGEDLTNFSLE